MTPNRMFTVKALPEPSFQNVKGFKSLSVGFLYPEKDHVSQLSALVEETLQLGNRWRHFKELRDFLAGCGSIERLQESHYRFFGPNSKTTLDLSFYFSDNPFEQSKVCADAAGFYRAFGVEPKEGTRPDNISLALEFYSYLNLKLANARKQNLEEPGNVTGEALLWFKEQFLEKALSAFHRRLSQTEDANLYTLLSRMAIKSIDGG